ncbi:MAG: DUF2332 family protein [Rhodobacteraceae bacterium]|nr:DUF2332 family protein [Paracoccaceae bacterium]
MDARLHAALDRQATACAALGSDFTARLMRIMAEVWPSDTGLAQRVAAWPGDLGPGGASLPLRIAGGLHALVLEGKDAGLVAVYPPYQASDTGLAQAVARALHRHDAALCDWICTAPQTNEVGRSAVLLAAAAELTARFGLPLVLSELGASAGLNLWCDRFALRLPGPPRSAGLLGAAESTVVLRPDWSGVSPPVVPIRVAARRGVDLNPLDPLRDKIRLMAFVWPDQTDRLARLRAALALAQGGCLDTGDAADWLEARLATPWPGHLHLVCHTIAHQYFPAPTKARIARAMQAAGAQATPQAPLAWLAMEADGGDGAGLTLRLWPGDARFDLGRAGFHGQWLRWRGM